MKKISLPWQRTRTRRVAPEVRAGFPAASIPVLTEALCVYRPEQLMNLPPVPVDGVRGARLTRLGSRVYSGSLKPMRDPWDRDIFWIGGGSITWTGEPDSDFRAIQEGFISITPLHLDLTNYSMLESSGSWWREL